jgi:hypothetical protein
VPIDELTDLPAVPHQATILNVSTRLSTKLVSTLALLSVGVKRGDHPHRFVRIAVPRGVGLRFALANRVRLVTSRGST